jgi:hypothetical protein
MLWTELRSVVVDTWLDCWPAPRAPDGDSDVIEYMDIRLAIVGCVGLVMSGEDNHEKTARINFVLVAARCWRCLDARGSTSRMGK